MKILLTQRKLMDFHGSEMVTLELAIALKMRGHEVAVYCPRPGDLVNMLASNEIGVFDHIADIPFLPDVIHAHHRLPALVALSRFQTVPCVFMCHGLRPWPEQPPRHPQIKAYVTVSQKLATHIATKLGIARKDVRIIPNFVDTKRFSRVRKLESAAPRRAVLFGQLRFPRDELAALRQACEAHGIELDLINHTSGPIHSHPELFMPDYDIAFAIGRSAVEAMACGCATIPVVPLLGGELVTSKTLKDWTAKNFSPRYFASAERIDADWLGDQLKLYDPDDVAKVTRRIRTHYSINRAVSGFETIYQDAIAAPVVADVQAGFTDELERVALEADELWEAERRARGEDVSVTANVLDRHIKDLEALSEGQQGLLALMEQRDEARRGKRTRGSIRPAIERSGLFDKDWYLASNPDVAKAGVDALEHYLAHGAFEGRDPSPCFANDAFLKAHPHLRAVRISPLEFLIREAAGDHAGIDRGWWQHLSGVLSHRLAKLFG